MTQIFNITIDGVLVGVDNCSISEEINRFYDVATFSMPSEPKNEAPVVINFGDRTFMGFVYKTSKISKLLYKVEIRTSGAKLTEPYSVHTEGFDEATTSHTLCALYANQSGIPINITAEDITFGGSYERTGTMLSALSTVARVTGAEYWDDGSSIQIQPNKPITISGTELDPLDIFDFVASTRSVYNKGVGVITIRNGGSETNDIISTNRIYAEVDECSGEIFVYPNPKGVIDNTVGLSALSPIIVDRSETNNLLDIYILRLEGAIESVNSVTLNGVEVFDYDFVQGHNVIYFNTLKRGALAVTYKAYSYHGYTNISNTPIGRFVTFDIFYLEQVLKFEGLLSADCLNSASDGDMTCIVPSDLYYNAGFEVWTIAGVPQFFFFNRNIEIVRPVTSVVENYVAVEDATLEEMTGGYRYKTRYPITTALGLQSSGVDVAYTTSVDLDGNYYFEVTQYYPSVKVSYETVAKKHTVQFATIENGEITMGIKNLNTDQICEYEIETKIPCKHNQFYPINIATQLGMEVVDVRGFTLVYLKPDDKGSGSLTVDDFGVVKVWVDSDGDYVIDTASLKLRTSVTLTVNVFGWEG